MKIQPREVRFITENVQLHDTPERRRAALAAGHSNKRYRWDCLWAAGLSEMICPTGANDDHLDTVLRRAIPDLS